MNPIRTAVVGDGQFGQNHCRVVHESPRAQLAVAAGKTLILDNNELLATADEAGIAIIRTAVVGGGQFGQNHCRVVHESPRAQLAIEAGKTFMLDKNELLAAADEARIAIVGLP